MIVGGQLYRRGTRRSVRLLLLRRLLLVWERLLLLLQWLPLGRFARDGGKGVVHGFRLSGWGLGPGRGLQGT